MKSLILTLALTFTLPVFAAPEQEKVCIKNSNGKETCKIVKKHKKLEGTAVPVKK